MKIQRNPIAAALSVVLASCVFATLAFGARAADEPKAPASAPKAALTVTTTTPQTLAIPLKISANGNIAAWQEAIVGTEANGLRLAEVRVNVGDIVKRGQVLASFAPDTVLAELNQTRAAVAEAEATLAEASANAQRARELSTTGALSAQQINQYLTAERTAKARLDAQQAAAKTQQLRLQQTKVLAPDSGVISSRNATIGAVMPAGTEMFRLIRGGRLEWREGTLYPALHRLEAEGLVKAEWKDAPGSEGGAGARQRKYYAITRKGRTELDRRVSEWQDFSGAINMVLGESGGAR